jgi:hypothetical protein
MQGKAGPTVGTEGGRFGVVRMTFWALGGHDLPSLLSGRIVSRNGEDSQSVYLQITGAHHIFLLSGVCVHKPQLRKFLKQAAVEFMVTQVKQDSHEQSGP